ncbi:MAG: metal ABC transporter permease [Peptococcaceae bacterium]|nr:metal ABC transporter permease [Peptococcaceae bacterium]
MDFLVYEFMQRALVAGLLAGIICAVVSLFVIVQRMAFATVGISHSALGGIAIGVLGGLNPVLCAAFFCTLVAWGIGLVSKKGNLHEDTVIGVFFSTTMALGVTLISLAKGYYPELFSYLFGNILAVTSQDLSLLGIGGTIILLFLGLFFKELLFLCFDSDVARVSGIPVTPLYFALLTAIALTVVISVKILGIVLASALLTIPAITGLELTRNFRGVLAVAIATGVVSSLVGLWLSYALNLPSGATIVLCAAMIFFASFVFSPRRKWVVRSKK